MPKDQKSKGLKKGRSSSASRQTQVDKFPSCSSSSSSRDTNSYNLGGGGGGNGEKSPRKKGRFVDINTNRRQSNLYSVRTKNNLFLIVFAEDGQPQSNYQFPGTQLKAWAPAFDRDIKEGNAWAAGTSPISCIVRRRDYRTGEEEDEPLSQRNSERYPMNAYICPLDYEDTPASVCADIIDKLRSYSAKRVNNMKVFSYAGEVTRGKSASELHSLDYYLLTKDVVMFSKSLYDEELANGTFYDFPDLLGALFERSSNTEDIHETMNQYF